MHAAAYTDVAAAEQNRAACWRTNMNGSRAVAQAAIESGVFLVYISTDYVFEGTRGMYQEEDPPGPVCNCCCCPSWWPKSSCGWRPGT